MLQRLRDALADIETLLIPILFNNNHWLLFVMDFNAKGWVFFDSMASLAKNAGRAAIAKVRLLLHFSLKMKMNTKYEWVLKEHH